MPADMNARENRPPAETNSVRMVSIDALRGFDMFWIMGGDFLFRSFRNIYDCQVTQILEEQMDHVPYEGFHFYDLIFPLFLFIVGVSITFSLPGLIERKGLGTAVKKIILRSVLLFLLGIFYMGGIQQGFANIYLAGVLQRIAVAYLFGALFFSVCRPKQLVAIAVFSLLGYYAILALVPVPGFGEASFEQGRNLAHYIDQWLPGRKFEGTILSTLGAVGNVLIGVLVGIFLRKKGMAESLKVRWLARAGIISLITGYTWGLVFPIIKLLWTSSYVLVACGYGLLFLAIFYELIEIRKKRKWAEPFIWIGMNSITIYIASSLFNFRKLSLRIVGGEVKDFLGNFGELAVSLVTLFFVFWLAKFLYDRKIFLKI